MSKYLYVKSSRKGDVYGGTGLSKKNNAYTLSSSSLLSAVVRYKLLKRSQWCAGETQAYPLEGGCGGVRHC